MQYPLPQFLFLTPIMKVTCFPKNITLYGQFFISFLKICSSQNLFLYLRHLENRCLEWIHQNLVGFVTLDLCLQRSHMLGVFLWSS